MWEWKYENEKDPDLKQEVEGMIAQLNDDFQTYRLAMKTLPTALMAVKTSWRLKILKTLLIGVSAGLIQGCHPEAD